MECGGAGGDEVDFEQKTLVFSLGKWVKVGAVLQVPVLAKVALVVHCHEKIKVALVFVILLGSGGEAHGLGDKGRNPDAKGTHRDLRGRGSHHVPDGRGPVGGGCSAENQKNSNNNKKNEKIGNKKSSKPAWLEMNSYRRNQSRLKPQIGRDASGLA